MLGRKIKTLLEVSREANCPLLVGKVILVFLSISTKRQALSAFEAMNSAHVSMCQNDVSILPHSLSELLNKMCHSGNKSAEIHTMSVGVPCSTRDPKAFSSKSGMHPFLYLRARAISPFLSMLHSSESRLFPWKHLCRGKHSLASGSHLHGPNQCP